MNLQDIRPRTSTPELQQTSNRSSQTRAPAVYPSAVPATTRVHTVLAVQQRQSYGPADRCNSLKTIHNHSATRHLRRFSLVLWCNRLYTTNVQNFCVQEPYIPIEIPCSWLSHAALHRQNPTCALVHFLAILIYCSPNAHSLFV